jgi:hypothetical protein
VKNFKTPRIGGSLIPKFLNDLNWGYSQNQIPTQHGLRVETSTQLMKILGKVVKW